MPISIGHRSFPGFKKAVQYIKRTRPDIEDPEAYVATIERRQGDNAWACEHCGMLFGSKKIAQHHEARKHHN